MKNKQKEGEKYVLLYKAVLLLVVLGFYQNLSAQGKYRFSLSHGVNNNSITYNAPNRVNTEYKGESGNYLKLGFNLKLYEYISIETGVTYLNKNYRFLRTGEEMKRINTLHETRYFNIPVMIGISPLYNVLKDSKFNFEMYAGFYVGWWNSLERTSSTFVLAELNADGTLPVKEVRESYDFSANENHFNRLDYGLQAETRIEYNFHKSLNFFIEYSLIYGLSDNQKKQMRKTSLYYYTISNYGIGLSYKF